MRGFPIVASTTNNTISFYCFNKIHLAHLRSFLRFRLYNSCLCNNQNVFNAICGNFTKWSNTLEQFVGKLPTNCLSVFDHFVGLALKGLIGTKAFMQAQLNGIMPPLVPEILIAWKKAFLKFYFLYGITAKFWAIMFVKILMKIFRSVIFT